MSVSSNGTVSTAQSMNGLITINADDITTNNITANIVTSDLLISGEIQSQNINAQDGLADCSLFNNDYATVTIGNSTTTQLNFGAFQFLVDTIRHITTALNLYIFPTSTGIINFATSASQIIFGNSTALVSSFVPTADNHLVNKLYVDSAGGILSSNNIFTGTNKFTSPSLTPGFLIDAQTSGEVSLDFKTNSSAVGQRVSSIVATGTGALKGFLEFLGTTFTFTGQTQSLYMQMTTANTVAMVFRTNPASPTQASSYIAATGGTTTSGGQLILNGIVGTTGALLTIDTVTNYISGTKTYINSTTTDINSTTTTVSQAMNITGSLNITSGVMNGTVSSGNLILFKGDSFQVIAPTTITLDPSTLANGAMLAVGYTTSAYFGITLSTTGIRDGQYFTIYNGGSNQIQILTLGNRLFGPGCTRGGQSSFYIISNDARRFRACTFGTTSMLQGGTYGQGYFVEFIS